MLTGQVKDRLTAAVSAAATVMRGNLAARLSPMLLHALPADGLAAATGTPPGELSDLVAQTAAIPRHPGAEAVRLLQPAILSLLAEGRPATPQQLAALTDRSATEVAQLLRTAAEFPGAELDARGRVRGLGLSLLPTPHRVQLRNQRHLLYAWCAPDALILPSLTGRHAQVTSPCRVTSEETTIELIPGGIAKVDPPQAVLSAMAVIDPADIRGTGCGQQHFFASAKVAAGWLDQHPGAFLLGVAYAYDLLWRLPRDLPASCGQDTTATGACS